MKKSTFILAFITIFGIIAAISTSCKKDDPAPTQEYYVIKVDSIIYPDTITVGDTLKIKFYGLVGENSCYQFAQWNNEFDVDLIQLTTMGIHYLTQECYEGITYLDGAEYQLRGVPKGSYTIKIVQPDNSTMDSQLYVKE
ncbi:MAG TPA: hypothetical protein VIN10_14465 [Bacteroidales bacterium]